MSSNNNNFALPFFFDQGYNNFRVICTVEIDMALANMIRQVKYFSDRISYLWPGDVMVRASD